MSLEARPHAVITGFTSGIGYEVTRSLLAQGWRVTAIARDEQKAKRCAEVLRVETGSVHLRHYCADLSLVKNTLSLAQKLLTQEPAIDLLINNAGGLFHKRSITSEGLELGFALNHMAAFTLTTQLAGHLTPTARILTISSMMHRGGSINLTDLHMNNRPYKAWTQYSNTKLMNILFTLALRSRLHDGQSAVAAHPGFVATNFGQAHNPLWLRLLLKVMMWTAITPQQAAAGVMHAATDPAGHLYYNTGIAAQPAPQAMDSDMAEKLWQASTTVLDKLA
jgi:NAD(P)-dependent dehydrogenase (short-subunit alcohol dehydrogenase family)